MTCKGVVTRYVYGELNRLTDEVNKASQKTTSYLVDTDTSYAQVIEERAPDTSDAAGNPALQARYVWGGGLAPLAMWRKMQGGSVKLFFYTTDGQESVRQLTSATGQVTDSYFYDAWGNGLAGGSGTTENPFRYTGQQRDPDGRYYLRARFYNPGNGRFLSHDPLMGQDQDPASLHRYLYAEADGVNVIDPSGQEGEGGVAGSIAPLAPAASLDAMLLTESVQGATIAADLAPLTDIGLNVMLAVATAPAAAAAGAAGVTAVVALPLYFYFATHQNASAQSTGQRLHQDSLFQADDDVDRGNDTIVYHYTDLEGYMKIFNSGYITPSNAHVSSQGHVYPQGQYFTSLPPGYVKLFTSNNQKSALCRFLWGGADDKQRSRLGWFIGFRKSDVDKIVSSTRAACYVREASNSYDNFYIRGKVVSSGKV